MMKHVNCYTCDKNTIFAEDPNDVPGATKYWKSVVEGSIKTIPCLFAVTRHIPYLDKNDKQKIQILYEYIERIYCSAKCGLDDYEKQRN